MEAMFDDLINLLQSAKAHYNCNSHKQALDIYAQIIDTYLSKHNKSIIILFDQIIAELLSQLDISLVEASSLMISKPSQPSDPASISDPSQPSDPASISDPSTANVSQRPLSPLLSPEVRCSWIKRLFSLWLKYRDRHQVSEQLQEMLFEVAWREDIPFLRTLIESELHTPSSNSQVHVADCAKESHTSALEKFLKHLPQ
jgi:hypothetical protein